MAAIITSMLSGLIYAKSISLLILYKMFFKGLFKYIYVENKVTKTLSWAKKSLDLGMFLFT
jgi:hypothetical protein